MDIEQEEMQFLGILDIYKESYKLIFTWRKIFTRITLSLILPLSFIFLAQIQISDLIFANILHDEIQLDETRDGAGSPHRKKLNDLVSSEWAYYWLFKAAYFTFFLVFSLLSTAAVVYTVASVYTGREITFGKVMSVVPKVWKRLIATFLCVFAALFAYNVVAALAFILVVILTIESETSGVAAAVVFLTVYFAGIVYLSIVFQLASVVSVLEEARGFKAMVKSRALIKGKMGMSGFIFFKLNVFLYLIQFAFEKLVVHGGNLGIMNRVFYGIICLLLLFKLFLFGLVIQTVIYFVCKSYHHENIDKSALSDHLEVYLGEYVPLKAKDVQLQEFDV